MELFVSCRPNMETCLSHMKPTSLLSICQQHANMSRYRWTLSRQNFHTLIQLRVCSTCTLLPPLSLGNNRFASAPGGTAQFGSARTENTGGENVASLPAAARLPGRGLPVSGRVPERQKAKVSRQIERRAVASPNLINDGTEGNPLAVQVMETTW